MSEESIVEQSAHTEDSKSENVGLSLPPNFSDMLGRVLANPEILGTIASAITQGKGESEVPVSQNEAEGKAQANTPEDEAVAAMVRKLPEITKLLSPTLAGAAKEDNGASGQDKRTCLLAAVKPFLSEGRREAVDYIIKFSRLSEILKNLG